VVPLPHVRTIGPDDNGHEVVLRYGDRLDMVPATRPHGWMVTDFAADLLRLQASPDAASSHTFVAVAVGEGKVVLTAGGAPPGAAGVFTVRIRVIRDLIQPAQP
jgi:hypothetical protein